MAPRQPLSRIPCVGTSTTVPSRLNITTVSRRAWDDNLLEDRPTRNVDYLSYKWEEEDIWSSWRYVVAKNDSRDKIRLENASWRSWAKLKYHLPTVFPETIDWSKDSDVTWLYGPLQICTRRAWASDSSLACDLSMSNFSLDKNLKRKSTSKAISQRSLLAHTLLKNAAAIVQAQEDSITQSRNLDRSESTPRSLLRKYVFGSSSSTPRNTPTGTPSSRPLSPQGRCRIHFKNEVQYCYEPKYGEDRRADKHQLFDNDVSLENWFVMKMHKGDNSNQCTASEGLRRRESKNITPLLTTLKYQGNTPDIAEKGSLVTYDYATDQTGTWIGILIWMVAGYCFLGWQCWRLEGGS